MIVFILANLLNFVALQFAPQSIIGPLGSISLVVNVIVAPMINNESWSYRDVIGIVFVVVGSSLVVVFGSQSVSNADYNLCTLLTLFRAAPTIVFLSVTSGMIAVAFVTIVIVEKNLDVEEPVKDANEIIKETLQGELVDVVENSDEPNCSQIDQTPTTFLDCISGVVVEAKDKPLSDGKTQRILTLRPNSVVDTTEDLEKKKSAESPETPISSISADNDLAATSRQSTRSRSAHTISLTFVIDTPKHQVPPPQSASATSSKGFETLLKSMTSSRKRKLSNTHDAIPEHNINTGDIEQHEILEMRVIDGRETNGANPTETAGVDSQVNALEAGTRSNNEPLSLIERLKQQWMESAVRQVICSIELVPRLEKKFAVNSTAVVYALPLLYAMLGGLMATLTTLFAKVTIHLLTESLVKGNNQYTSFSPFVITGVTVFTAVMQIYWLNMGLERYDALLQIPVFYVLWRRRNILWRV